MCQWIAGIFGILVMTLIGIRSADKLGQDNPIEEIIEEKIKEATGIDVDLSPGSPENVPVKKKAGKKKNKKAPLPPVKASVKFKF